MLLETIHEHWAEDTYIDKTELSDEALKIPKLHEKYYKIFTSERMILRALEFELKKLKLDKFEFYSQGHNEETRVKGWKLPAKGMILKSEVPNYVDADDDIIKILMKIGIQLEKIEFLESIIKSIGNSGYLIKSAIDWQKFIMGN